MALIGVVIPLAAISVTSLLGTISGGLSWSNLDLRHYTPLVAPGSRAAQALMNERLARAADGARHSGDRRHCGLYRGARDGARGGP